MSKLCFFLIFKDIFVSNDYFLNNIAQSKFDLKKNIISAKKKILIDFISLRSGYYLNFQSKTNEAKLLQNCTKNKNFNMIFGEYAHKTK